MPASPAALKSRFPRGKARDAAAIGVVDALLLSKRRQKPYASITGFINREADCRLTGTRRAAPREWPLAANRIRATVCCAYQLFSYPACLYAIGRRKRRCFDGTFRTFSVRMNCTLTWGGEKAWVHQGYLTYTDLRVTCVSSSQECLWEWFCRPKWMHWGWLDLCIFRS